MKAINVIKEVYPKNEYPQLYSRRGFEKKRFKVIIPEDRTEYARIVLKGIK